jgi:hypothetical protein
VAAAHALIRADAIEPAVVSRAMASIRCAEPCAAARIESGRECERLAPALSALVDGEGDAAQAVDLRMHLRQCLACRAAVRGLHDAARSLTVVFPAAGLAVAGGGSEQAHSFFVRVYETAAVDAHDRAANSFLRAQAIVDTLAASKMAAAAASAAALAGGGVAVEGVLTAAPATPQAIVRRADHGLATTFVKAPPKTSTHAKHRPHSRTSTPHRHQKAQPAAAHVVRAAVTTTQRTPAPPASSAARASAASASAGGRGSASSEFGFEGR